MRILHNAIFEQTKVWLSINVLLSVFYGFAALFLEVRPDGRALSWCCCAPAAAIAVFQARSLATKRYLALRRSSRAPHRMWAMVRGFWTLRVPPTFVTLHSVFIFI